MPTGSKVEAVGSAAAVVAVALLLVHPVVARPTWWLWSPGSEASDLAVTHWPNALFTRRSLWGEGQFPIWRPTIMSGAPFAANPLTGLYYAPNWPLLFLPWLPLAVGFNLSALLHLALAGATMYLLLRHGIGTSLWAGLVSAVAYAASPKLVAHLGAGHVGWVQAWAWLPLVVLCALKACQGGGDRAPSWALGAGVALAAQFCADVRLTAYSLIAACSLVATRVASRLIERRNSAAPLRQTTQGLAGGTAGRFVGALAVFLGLSACQWFPGLALLPSTTRSSMTLSDAAIWSLPWRYLSGLLLADHGGFQEWMTYVGVSTLGLAAVGGSSLWHGSDGERAEDRRWLGAWLTGLAAFAAWFSLGEHAGLFQALWRVVPGLTLLRVPPRAWVLVSLSSAVLGGTGLEAILRRQDRGQRRPGRWKRALLVGAAAFAPMLTVAYWLIIDSPPLNLVMFGLVTPLTIGICSAPLGIGVRPCPPEQLGASAENARGHLPTGRPSRYATWLGVATFLLVTVDLFAVDFTLVEARSPKDVFREGQTVAAWLADQPGRFRVYSPSYSVPQHVAERYELELADGVDPLQLTPYADYLTRAAGLEERERYSVTLPPFPEDSDVETALADVTPDTAMLGKLGVRYIAAAFPLTSQRLDLVHRSDDAYLYRNRDARAPVGGTEGSSIRLADGRVLFDYRPWAVYAGWGVSGLTSVVVALSFWRLRRRPAVRTSKT